MIDVTVFDDSTGEIVRSMQVTFAETADANTADGESWLYGKGDPKRQFVRGGALAERPTLPPPSAGYDLAALPAGTAVTVWNEAGEAMTITDLTGTLILTDPGRYRFRIDPPFPFLRVDEDFDA